MIERDHKDIEAATFRRLLEHLDNHKDVQNIDLMNLASFCRNCLSKWYKVEAEKRGYELGYEDAREIVYGMPYSRWKAEHQSEPTSDQLEKFKEQSS